MRKIEWRQWLAHTPMNPLTNSRRRTTRRRRALVEPAAEVAELLENRLLLTANLVFVLQPSNGIAGHALNSFTVDVVNPDIHRRGASVIDTSYSGAYLVTANGPGVLDSPSNSTFQTPNVPLNVFEVFINKGVGKYLGSYDLAAIDVAGTYTLTATSPAGANNPGVPGTAVSSPFKIAVDSASDHLVFGNPLIPIVGIPTSVNVAVEDQFGNVDTSVSKVSVDLFIFPGTMSTAELSAGKATFNNVIFAGPGPDLLLAFGFGGPDGLLVGTAMAQVIRLPTEP
jgi:hypothetical protein